MTNWVVALGVKEAKVLLQLLDRTANFQCGWGLQVATTDTDAPSNPVLKGTYRTTNGKECSGVVSLGTDVDDAFFVRFGVFVKRGSGTNTERGQVSLAVGTRS